MRIANSIERLTRIIHFMLKEQLAHANTAHIWMNVSVHFEHRIASEKWVLTVRVFILTITYAICI